MNKTTTNPFTRTFSEPVSYNKYIAEYGATTPEDAFQLKQPVNHYEVLWCLLVRSSAIVAVLTDDDEANTYEMDVLWALAGMLEQAKCVLDDQANVCNTCRKCVDYTRDGILSKIQCSEPNSKEFALSVQFLMALDDKTGKEARKMFQETEDLYRLKSEMIQLLEIENKRINAAAEKEVK